MIFSKFIKSEFFFKYKLIPTESVTLGLSGLVELKPKDYQEFITISLSADNMDSILYAQLVIDREFIGDIVDINSITREILKDFIFLFFPLWEFHRSLIQALFNLTEEPTNKDIKGFIDVFLRRINSYKHNEILFSNSFQNGKSYLTIRLDFDSIYS